MKAGRAGWAVVAAALAVGAALPAGCGRPADGPDAPAGGSRVERRRATLLAERAETQRQLDAYRRLDGKAALAEIDQGRAEAELSLAREELADAEGAKHSLLARIEAQSPTTAPAEPVGADGWARQMEQVRHRVAAAEVNCVRMEQRLEQARLAGNQVRRELAHRELLRADLARQEAELARLDAALGVAPTVPSPPATQPEAPATQPAMPTTAPDAPPPAARSPVPSPAGEG